MSATVAKKFRVVVFAALLCAMAPGVGAVAVAQRGYYGMACRLNWDADNFFVSPFFRGNPRYDGRVTFARIKYRGAYECGGEGPGWSHDYPRTDFHFMRILKEITSIHPFVESGPIIGAALV